MRVTSLQLMSDYKWSGTRLINFDKPAEGEARDEC